MAYTGYMAYTVLPPAKGHAAGLPVARLPMLPPEYSASPMPGEMLPNRVAYVIGGGLIPHMPADPETEAALLVQVTTPYSGKLPNGLSPRADCMARLIARGVSGADAYRASFGKPGTPRSVVARSWSITRAERFRRAVLGYREMLARERLQTSYGIRDFVLSRLTLEAQTAPETSSRIRALELLGKTEALFTTVTRHENVIDPASLNALKAQLEQRLRSALTRLVPGLIAAPLEVSSTTEDEPRHDDAPTEAPKSAIPEVEPIGLSR